MSVGVSSSKGRSIADDKKCPNEITIPLPHYQQEYGWDCGLACGKMVLSYVFENDYLEEKYRKNSNSLNCNNSVWTIDIAHLMSLSKIKHKFYTLTLGVDPDYQNEKFYEDCFSSDQLRVNSLFTSSKYYGIQVERREVGMEEIQEHLSRRQVVIVLVNSLILPCVWCQKSKGCWEISCCVQECSMAGHFIVLCGFNRHKNWIYYKDPSSPAPLCCCDTRDFDKARKSYGTDQDILFIYK